jgi:hypothetical protein
MLVNKLDNKKYIAYVLILFILFITTQNFYTIQQSLGLGYSDIKNYLLIAQYKSNNEVFNKIPIHHLERWPIHYLIGNISRLLNIKIHITYLIFQLISLIIIIILVNEIRITLIKKLCIISLLMFNPYLYRLYFCIPEMITDTFFIVGGTAYIIGLIKNNKIYMYLGLFILFISRQTSYIMIPIIFILFYYKYINFKNLIQQIIFLIFGIMLIKISTTFFYNNNNINNKYILYHLKEGWINLGNQILYNKEVSLFIIKYIIFIITILPLLILIEKKDYIQNKIWFLFLILINLQPLIGGPLITSGNIQRLSALGIFFIIPIIINSNVNNKKYILFIILSIITSFHHKFSKLYFITNSKIYYEYILVILIILVTIIKNKKNVINNYTML